MASSVGISVVFKSASLISSFPLSHLNEFVDVSWTSAIKSTFSPSQITAGSGCNVTSAILSTKTARLSSRAGHLSPIIVNLYMALSVGISVVDNSASVINSLPRSHLNVFADVSLALAIKSTFSPSQMTVCIGCSVTYTFFSTFTLNSFSKGGHNDPSTVNLYVTSSVGISVVVNSVSLISLLSFSHLNVFSDINFASATKSIFSPSHTAAGICSNVTLGIFSTMKLV